MGHSSFLSLLLMSTLLVLSFSPGWGRKVIPPSGSEDRDPSFPLEENAGISREMMELDYVEAGPNVNPKAGQIPPPPSSPPAPES